MAIGLAGYAIWRLVRAAIGHGPEATDDAKERIDGLASGIGYAMLCVTAVSILTGAGAVARAQRTRRPAACSAGRPGRSSSRSPAWSSSASGSSRATRGSREKFLEKSKTEQMSEGVERSFTALGVVGHLARMVVFTLIGYFLIRAAIDFDPDKAVSLDGALSAVAHASTVPASGHRRGRPDRVRRVLRGRRPLSKGVRAGSGLHVHRHVRGAESCERLAVPAGPPVLEPHPRQARHEVQLGGPCVPHLDRARPDPRRPRGGSAGR